MVKCELCNRQFKSFTALSKHLSKIHHFDKQLYYNIYYLKSPLDGFCKTCGKPTKFLDISRGYRDHCNIFCAQQDPDIISKIQTDEAHQKISNSLKNTFKNNPEINKRAVQLRKQYNLEKYGVSNSAQRIDVINKFKNTHKDTIKKFCEENNCTTCQELIKSYGQAWLKLNIPYIIHKHVKYIKNSDVILIERLYDQRSTPEKIIYNFLTRIYDGEILRNKRIIYPQELDFYLPDLNLGIEYNSSYYHCIGTNAGVQDEYYHYNKSKECFLQGIRLIHIYEFEDLFYQLMLLKSLIYYGFDRYNLDDNNKNWHFDDHKPEVIGYYNKYPIYGA